ncbi:hypothetical protein [Psychrosphaera aestuarii]|uniref:hypothetical protein n=1 Tax=Psychrosphaera aestuarii TaxID=1266052 RepID=UPI001B32B192|nr:hypothetical protein [Psychrosphaera aestuarii]
MSRKYLTACKVVSLFTISLLVADSILLSASQVHYHFNKTSSYVYAAASSGEGLAAYQLYQTKQNIYWLEEAAMAGHIDAIWELHVKKAQQDVEYNNIWLEVALKSGHPIATLNRIEQLVTLKEWQSASLLFAELEKERLAEQDFSAVALFEHLKDAVLLLKSNSPDSKTKRQTKRNVANLNQSINYSTYDRAWREFDVASSCELKVLVYSSSLRLAKHSGQLIEQFFSLLPNSQQAICFSPITVDYRLNRICDENNHGLLTCDKKSLGNILQEALPISIEDKKLRLLVVGETGRANSVGPLIYLDYRDTAQVLLHEVGHWLNLYDEYKIARSHQQIFCNESSPTELGFNLVIAPRSYAKSTLEQQFSHPLWPVDTCEGTNNNAFKKQPSLSPMEYFDVALPREYLPYFETPVLNPNHTSLDIFFR